jgi:hypothetical protein
VYTIAYGPKEVDDNEGKKVFAGVVATLVAAGVIFYIIRANGI